MLELIPENYKALGLPEDAVILNLKLKDVNPNVWNQKAEEDQYNFNNAKPIKNEYQQIYLDEIILGLDPTPGKYHKEYQDMLDSFKLKENYIKFGGMNIEKVINPPKDNNLNKVSEEMSKVDKKLLSNKSLKELQGLYYYAGGCVRDLYNGNKKPKDYDIYFFDEESKNKAIAIFEKEENKNKFKKTINGNYNYGKYQFITLVTGTPKEVTNRSDFSINTGYYCPEVNDKVVEKKQLYIPDDLKTKTLNVMDKVFNPVNALIRLERFVKEGYKSDIKNLLKLSIQIQKRPDLTKEENLVKECMGLSFGFDAKEYAKQIYGELDAK